MPRCVLSLISGMQAVVFFGKIIVSIIPFIIFWCLISSVLGKRLGKSMGIVAKEVKAMSQTDILAFEKAGELTIANHYLKLSDIKVHLYCYNDVITSDCDVT